MMDTQSSLIYSHVSPEGVSSHVGMTVTFRGPVQDVEDNYVIVGLSLPSVSVYICCGVSTLYIIDGTVTLRWIKKNFGS